MTNAAAIRTLLVANRGEVARRVFRTCRHLGIRTVAVYTPPDAGAPFVAEADAAVPLDGVRGYLDIDQILAAAESTGADAVHPGWGFLAENAPFARACTGAGLIWVGPPPEAMEAMGSKIEARRLMEAAGVPIVPGATLRAVGAAEPTGVRLPEYGGKGTPVQGGAAAEAADGVAGEHAALRAAGERIGFPLLVKASAGGGGKGMRLVTEAGDLPAAVADAAREAASAFGDPAVFLERYVSPGRHVEVQVIGDHHGTVVHLFERDCSVQRRHQKLVEEAPSPAVDDDLRARMGEAAVAAAKAVGYHGVGTVECLLGPDGSFYFMEMNTRLQVEHPVTELVTGIDLVALQIAVAEGRPLPAEVRDARMSGHAIEVRLYAEDPLHDYQPQTGRIEALGFPDLPGLRIDSGVEAGSVIGADYDSMLGKVIATGPTRAGAVRLLVDALRRGRVHGVGTNRDLLVAILDHDEFGAGKADTGFLERHPPEELLASALDPRALQLHALAAALAAQAENRNAATVLRPVRTGFRNNPGPPAVRRFIVGTGDAERVLEVGYRIGRDTGVQLRHPSVADERRSSLFTVDGEVLPVTLIDARPDAVDLVVDGVRRRVDVRRYDHAVHVDSAMGSAAFRPVDRFPSKEGQRPSGSLVAPMPGTVVKVLAAPGDAVTKGDPVVVIEAMKMEHTIGAAGDGTVHEILVEVGRQVDIDQVIAVITGADSEESDASGNADG
jgi:acetyl/propionyl-CoA carboxylase alpha subunit